MQSCIFVQILSKSHFLHLSIVYPPLPWCNFPLQIFNHWFKFWILTCFCKVLSIYLSQEILIFLWQVLFLEKDETCFLVQDVTCGEVIFFIFKLKKKLSAYEEKIGFSLYLQRSVNKNRVLTLFRMGFFRPKRLPLPKICHVSLTMRKLGGYTLPKEDP